jgi:hypothetical protein
MTTVAIRGGHVVSVEGGKVFVIDASGDRGQVDPDLAITMSGRPGGCDVPLVGGGSSPVPPEEALLIAAILRVPVHAGARRFRVEQVWSDGSTCRGHRCPVCRSVEECAKIDLDVSAHGPQECRACRALLGR